MKPLASTGISRVLCLGLGRMAQGIALHYAIHGIPVVLLDCRVRTDEAFAQRVASVRKDIAEGCDLIRRIGLVAQEADLSDFIEICNIFDSGIKYDDDDLIYECVSEEIAIKHEALQAISSRCSPRAIIASTTSTIMVDDLTAAVSNPERFLNAHWLNPAYLVPLIEISAGEYTHEQTTQMLKEHLARVGKQTVVCRSSPGFIVPRLQALVMNEAARMVEQGVASAADIDRAVHYGFGFRFAEIGLLEFIDWGGCDILFHASAYLSKALDDGKFEAAPIITENMHTHRRGLRDGIGFYDYKDRDVSSWRENILRRFVRRLKAMT
ncbi:MAG: 3-hydroxyacyl-CoA dehydrogenase NAD-binding domain-containing protein [Acetobacter sp.]